MLNFKCSSLLKYLLLPIFLVLIFQPTTKAGIFDWFKNWGQPNANVEVESNVVTTTETLNEINANYNISNVVAGTFDLDFELDSGTLPALDRDINNDATNESIYVPDMYSIAQSTVIPPFGLWQGSGTGGHLVTGLDASSGNNFFYFEGIDNCLNLTYQHDLVANTTYELCFDVAALDPDAPIGTNLTNYFVLDAYHTTGSIYAVTGHPDNESSINSLYNVTGKTSADYLAGTGNYLIPNSDFSASTTTNDEYNIQWKRVCVQYTTIHDDETFWLSSFGGDGGGIALDNISCYVVPEVTAFAIQSTCTEGTPNNDGYLQISDVNVGTHYNWSTGSTYTGATDLASATTFNPNTDLPLQFGTLANPSGAQDYTIRVFNGADECFTDIVLTMNNQDCTVGCDCEEKIYLNDVYTHEVHKFSITNTGSLSEIGSPWLANGNINSPHGLGVDVNGNLYIGEVTSYNQGVQGKIFKLDSDGNVLDNDFINLDNNNFGFQLMSKDGILYTTNNETNEVQAFDICTGDLIGGMQVGVSADILAWGMHIDEATNSWYVADRWSGNVYTGSLDTSLYNNPAISGSVAFDTGIIGAGSGDIAATGITRDNTGNFFIVYNAITGGAATVSIRKYDATGTLIATVSDNTDAYNTANGVTGFWGARGIAYSTEENKLYVSSRDNCITVFETDLTETVALNIGNPVNSSAKGIVITKECRLINNNVTIDTALCASGVNNQFFLQELINCEGIVSEGLWTEGSGNTGLTYNACDNSIIINSQGACGLFTLSSNGTGNNPRAFIITVNITVASLDLTVTQTGCTDNGNDTFTASYDVVVDWSSVPCSAGEMINVTHNGSSIGMINPSTDSSPSTFVTNIDADGEGSESFKAAFSIANCSSDSIAFYAPVPCPTAIPACSETLGCIGGNVFEDGSYNGINNTGSGIQGMEVQIFDCDNVLVRTAYTDSEGDWQVCALTDNTAYRVEFILSESIAYDYSPTKVGTDNKSDIQFSTTNNCLSFGLSPIDACAASLMLLTPCYSFGGYQGANKDNDAFVGVQMNRIDDPSVDATETVIHYATHEQIGTTYGTAVNRQTNTAYTAAYMKRHTGFGPDGTGAIYKIDLSQANPPSLLADLNSIYGAGTAGVNPHDFSEATTCPSSGTPDNFSCWFNDVDAFSKVGRTSLGDMDISTDESTLYVINLEDRNVYQIDLANPTAVQPTFSFPLDQVTDPNVTLKPRDAAYDIRPFGLSYHNDLIYVAAIDSEQSRDRDGVCCSESPAVVYVYSLDPTTGNWTLVLEESVQRGVSKFFHWRDDFKDDYRDGMKTIPSDIEFDGDDIVLGFRDISADQFGNEAGKPITGDGNTVFRSSEAGDIMRFCYDSASSTYNFESNGSCGGVTSAGANSGIGWPAATTPRGSYYSGDYYNSYHPQTSLGGIWLNPADNRLYTTVYDINAVYNAGIKALDNTTGLTREGYILIADSQPNGGFGKAAGLGDVEASCPILSLEIGNYVWFDSLGNGIQDACESGIDDIIVQLYDQNGLLVGQDTTILGNYYFNQKNVDTTGISIDGSGLATPTTAWSGVSYSAQYFIVFGGGQFNTNEFTVGSGSYGITSFVNAGSNNKIDSDVDRSNLTTGSLGARPDGLPFIDITTEATGSGDHKYDLGLTFPSTTIGNVVWLDENGDGVQDAGEAGIPNVVIELRDANNAVVATTITDTNGGYIFKGVTAGTYTVSVLSNVPTGLNPTYDENSATSSPDMSTSVTLVGKEYLSADFGYNWVPISDTNTPTMTSTGALGDRIWNDADGDGNQDAGEAGIPNITVNLYSDPENDGTYTNLVNSTITDGNGNYIFDNIPPDGYVIEVVSANIGAAGFIITPTEDPDGDGDNISDPVIIAPGDVWLGGDFGYNSSDDPADIGSTIYVDVDADGIYNAANDIPLAGVTIALIDDVNENGIWDSGEGVVATTETNSSGNYLFPDLPAKEYVVQVTDSDNVINDLSNNADPDGGNNNYSGISLGAVDNLSQNFGYVPFGHTSIKSFVGDLIYLDANGNGGYTPGESGIEGVEVQLLDGVTNTVLETTITNENGLYFFGNLEADDYKLKVNTATIPSGLTNSIDPDGSAPGDDESNNFALLAGTSNLTQDFGYKASTPHNINGTIWNDTDAEGIKDGTETVRFENVTIELQDVNGNIIASTTTDVSGNYTFEGIPDGTYTVEVTDVYEVLSNQWHSLGSDSENDPVSVTLSGTNITDIDFGYYTQPGALGNYVWDDVDGNGLQNSGESGLSGVIVILEIDYNNDGTTDITVATLTDGTGYYNFKNLLLDEDYNGDGNGTEPVYTLSATAPSGYMNTVINANGNGNDMEDADDPAGVIAEAEQGQSVTKQSDPNAETTPATFDFAFMSIALPLDLIEFKLELDGCKVDLTWLTENEKDFDYFELEWSGNGQDFRSIKKVIASGGNFTKLYNHTDQSASVYNYYRLKMVDLDGEYKYSKVLELKTDCDNRASISIYPNPIFRDFGTLNIDLLTPKTEVQIQITDMLGRVVQQLSLEVEPEMVNAIKMDISSLPSGAYSIQILGARKTMTFIIQE